MSSVAAVSTVATITVRLWAREIATLFRITERRVVILTSVGAVFAAGFGLLLGNTSTSQLPNEVPAQLRENILRTSFGDAVLTAALVSAILCITMPTRTALQTLLDLLPVERHIARAGQMAPLFIVGFAFSAALASIPVAVVAKIYADLGLVATTIALLAILILITQAVSIALFTIIGSSLNRFLKLPQQYSAAAAGGVVIALGILSMIEDIFAFGPTRDIAFTWRDLLPNHIAARLVTEPDLLSGVALAAWAVVAAALSFASAALYRQDSAPPTIRLFTRTRPVPTPFGAATWTEFLLSVCNPQAIMTALMLAPSIGLAKLAMNHPLLGEVAAPLATAIPVMPFYLSVYAVGRTLRTRWTGTHLLARSSWWATPKLLSYLCVPVSLATLVVVAEIALGMIEVDDLPSMPPRALLAFAAALVAGSLVPYGEEQPLSTTVSGFMTAMMYIGASLGISLLSDSLGPVGMSLLTTMAALVLLGGYRLIAASQNADDVHRI